MKLKDQSQYETKPTLYQPKVRNGSSKLDYSSLQELFVSVYARVRVRGRGYQRITESVNSKSQRSDNPFSFSQSDIDCLFRAEKERSVASEIARAIFKTRQGQEIKLNSACSIVGRAIALRTWDMLFSAFEACAINNGKNDEVDSNFCSVLESQLESKGSMNGEFIRQYLNTVLRGLPPSKALRHYLEGLPEQDVASSCAQYPECFFLLGRINNCFRRVFSAYYSQELFDQVEKDLDLNVLLISDALNDLYQFQRSMERAILSRFSVLLSAPVDGVVGDLCNGRVQDSRRGGDLGKTSDAIEVVQSCVEDAVLDPLVDTIFLIYSPLCSDEDKFIFNACVEAKSRIRAFMKEPEFELNASLEALEKAWLSRTPSSKMKHFVVALSLITPDDSSISCRKNVPFFLYLICCSRPFNLSTQYKFLIDTMTENHLNPKSRFVLALLGTAKLALLRLATTNQLIPLA